MTGARNGTVSLWNNKSIEKSVKYFNEWTLVFSRGDSIFAVSNNKDVLELNMNLDVVKKFTGRNSVPLSINANDNNLVVGYSDHCVCVHIRKKLDQNARHGQKLVLTVFCKCNLYSQFCRNTSKVVIRYVLSSKMMWSILVDLILCRHGQLRTTG